MVEQKGVILEDCSVYKHDCNEAYKEENLNCVKRIGKYVMGSTSSYNIVILCDESEVGDFAYLRINGRVRGHINNYITLSYRKMMETKCYIKDDEFIIEHDREIDTIVNLKKLFKLKEPI